MTISTETCKNDYHSIKISGSYCDSLGLTQPTGQCTAGYYCTSGANTSTPTDGTTGNICPQGHYCPMGSISQTQCADGTYMNTTGAAACLNCLAGFYCLAGATDVTICPQVSTLWNITLSFCQITNL